MRYLPGSLALAAAGCLALAMDLDLRATIVLPAYGVAGLWLVLPPHLFSWWSHVSLTVFTGLVAVALLQGGMPVWAVGAQCAALAAWDTAGLVHAGTRHTIDNTGALVRGRLMALGVVGIMSVVAAVVAARVSLTLTLPWALALTLALVVLVARLVRRALTTSNTRTD